MRNLTARDDAILAAARTGCVVFGRDDLVAVRVVGRDAVKFLHAMLTQDIKALVPMGSAQACLCDAQGAIVATMRVVVTGDGVALWTDRTRSAALLEALDRYVIADDVELALDERVALCELLGPTSCEVMRAAAGTESGAIPNPIEVNGQSVLAWRADLDSGAAPWWQPTPRLWLQSDRDGLGEVAAALLASGAQPGSHAAHEAIRVLAGEPRVGVDIDDGTLPLELGLADTVSFRKGCYLGQEAIAMMKYRGQPRRYLSWLAGQDAPPDNLASGWQLRTADGKRAGRLGTCVRSADGSWRALAVVQRKVIAPDLQLFARPDNDGEQAAQFTLAGTTMPATADAPASQGPAS